MIDMQSELQSLCDVQPTNPPKVVKPGVLER
jgi:hypothetical protein